MAHFLIQIYIIHLLIIPIGSLFISNSKNLYITYSSQLIYSIIVLSFFGLLLNFFFPLNIHFNSLLIILLLIMTLKRWKEFYIKKEFYIYCFFSTIIISFLLIESNVYRPDAGLYHLPYINILNEEKIIFGLSNLHFRYAHTSILQHTSAIFNNYLLGVNGIVIPSALLVSAVFINFTSRIINLINLKKYDFELIFLMFIQLFIFFKVNRYSEYGNDAPAHLLYFYLISKIIENKFSTNQILNVSLLILFIIQNKIILICSVLFILLFIKKEQFFELFKNQKFYFISIFFLLWIMKNIAISGCAIFPVTSTCYDGFSWSNKSLSKSVSIENEAWSKGWPDYRNKFVNTNLIKKYDLEDYSNDLNWITTWLNNHFLKISKIVLIYIFIIFLFSLFLFKEKKGFYIDSLKKKRHIKIIIFFVFVSTVLWFFKLPTFRYGYSYLISFISLSFTYILTEMFSIRENFKKKYVFILLIGILVFLVKNFIRIDNNNNNYNNYPWPKFYSMKGDNKFPQLNEFNISNIKFYSPVKESYCMYYKSPCINYGNYLNAKIKIINNYYVVYIK